MLTSVIARIVGFSVRHAWTALAVGGLLAAGASAYTATHFRLNSNIDALLSNQLAWRQRDIALERAFGNFDLI